MKIGLDIHGVINAKPELFSVLSKLIVNSCGEVHIITGELDSPKVRDELKNFGITYTHFFSISSYHLAIGTEVWYKDKNHPCMDEVIWNSTKAIYCEKNKIDLHIDDSLIYGKYFKTPYLIFQN